MLITLAINIQKYYQSSKQIYFLHIANQYLLNIFTNGKLQLKWLNLLWLNVLHFIDIFMIVIISNKRRFKISFKAIKVSLHANFILYLMLQIGQQESKVEQLYFTYKQKYKLDQKQIIQPEFNNNSDSMTFAMFLAQNSIIPPKQLYHNRFLINKFNQTVKNILISHDIIPPNEWKYNQMVMDALIQYCSIYNITDQNQIVLNPNYNHNRHRLTFAMHMVQRKIIPPQEFYHNKYIRDYNNHDIQYMLEQKHMNVSDQWKYDKTIYKNDKYETQAMLQAKQGKIPDINNIHDPYISDIDGNTVAMILSQNSIIPPKQWLHSPYLTNFNDETVALILAEKGIIPPEEWFHNPEIKNNKQISVSVFLASKGIKPPNHWLQRQFY